MTGVVVVTYNSEEVVGRCLDACLRLAGMEVLVVDNASSDGTLREVRKRESVRVLANVTNRGFAAAVNQGVAALDTDFVLILNPDVELLDSISPLLENCDGAAAGQLIDISGKSQDGFNVRGFPTPATLAFEVLGLNRIFPGNAINRRYRQPMPNGAVEVDQPAGAFLLVRRGAWRAIGGMDEAFYPVWFEDVDFCLRLQQNGFRVKYVPAVRARHVGGHSVKAVTWQSRELFWYGSLLRYAAKHFSPAGRSVVSVAVCLSGIPRMAAALLLRRDLNAVSVYSKVMGRAVLNLFGGRTGAVGAPAGVYR
jgi:GT2 family glycosyltransferase